MRNEPKHETDMLENGDKLYKEIIYITKKKLKCIVSVFRVDFISGKLFGWTNWNDAEKPGTAISYRLTITIATFGSFPPNLSPFFPLFCRTIFVIVMLNWQRPFERCHCEQCRWTKKQKIFKNLSSHWKNLCCDTNQLDTGYINVGNDKEMWTMLAIIFIKLWLFQRKCIRFLLFFGLNSSFVFALTSSGCLLWHFQNSATEYQILLRIHSIQIIIIIMEMCSRPAIWIRNACQKWHKISCFTFIKSKKTGSLTARCVFMYLLF